MSDNFWADILKGKMIVSGLKQEPEKTYREIKCLNCKYWQKVPLITEYNQDGTKKHPAFCDECGADLDAQEQVRKNKGATRREQVKRIQGSGQQVSLGWVFTKAFLFFAASMLIMSGLFYLDNNYSDYKIVKILFSTITLLFALLMHSAISLVYFFGLDFAGFNTIENYYGSHMFDFRLYENVELLPFWLAVLPVIVYHLVFFTYIYFENDNLPIPLKWGEKLFEWGGYLVLYILPFILYSPIAWVMKVVT